MGGRRDAGFNGKIRGRIESDIGCHRPRYVGNFVFYYVAIRGKRVQEAT
jgi:hypothetical protein